MRALGIDLGTSSALRLDGTQWSEVSTENPSENFSALGGVHIVSPASIFAVGGTDEGNPTMIQRSTGEAFDRKKAPRYAPLTGVTGAGTRLWAVGAYDTGSTVETLILQRCA